MTTILALLVVERLGWVLMHSLWQFMAIALVVRLFERTFTGRRSASLRYGAGICGLAAITVAPVATWVLIPEAPAPRAKTVSVVPFDDKREDLQVAQQGAPIALRPGPMPATVEAVDQRRIWYLLADARAMLALRLRPWLPMLVVGWLLGMSLCSLRPLVGWLTLRRLRTIGVSAPGQALAESARRIAARLGLTQAVSVWQSTVAKTPLVVGYLRPALLIPVAMLAQLPLAELEAILAHELAHVRRHDFLVNLWQTLLETAFYYHPAVWSLSRRLRAEREHCCDDVALSIVGDPVCYGRALLHAEELRGAESLLAFGAGGGSLRGRILRIFDQSSPPVSAAGLFAGAALPSLALVILVSALGGGAPLNGDEKEPAVFKGQDGGTKSPSPETAEATPSTPPARSLDIVIAKHTILWDGRIRTWDEVVAELREIRQAKGEPIHPHFRFTNGAHAAGHFKTYQAKAMEVYDELFEPAGMSLGSISPRAGPRYDAIRKAEDLVPDPATLRSGIVVEKGEPKAGVLVVLVPEEGVMPVMLKPDLTLRDRLDEVWTVTGPDGRFTLPVQPARDADELAEKTAGPTYSLAAISRTAYRLAGVPMKGEEARIELVPLAYVQLTPVEGERQRIDLMLRAGLSDTSPGFSIYEIELRDEARLLRLPAGKITVLRAFLHEHGRSQNYPAETVEPGPGAARKITLPNITEEQAKQKWIEGSLRPKSDRDDVLDDSVLDDGRVGATTSRAAFAAAVADDQPASAKQPDLAPTIAGSWTVTDPAKDCKLSLTGDKLNITVPATNHDLCPVRGLNAPRVLKKVKGDFMVQVKVTGDFKPGTTSTGIGKPFNGAGILLWQNEESFVRVERNAFWIGEILYCYPPIMEYWHNGKYSGANNDLIQADYFQGRSTWLKANRRGNNVAVSISHDGKQWSDVKTFPVELGDELFVGVAALNTSDTPFTVDFEELIIKGK